MKFVKMLGLLAVAATALMAFAGAASATTVTSSQGSTPGQINAYVEGWTTLHGVVDITCTASTVQSAVSSHGSGVTASGAISSLTFTNCGSNDVTVKKAGSLEVHALSGGNGTLTSSGAEISVQVTSLGITCVYTTSTTDIGEYSSAVGVIFINSALIPRTGGSIFCGSTATWTGSYRVTTPLFMSFDA